MKVKAAIILTIFLWSSAFVGIRMGLTAYSPGALALLRFLVASLCMAIIYQRIESKNPVSWSDRIQLLFLGFAGIGLYNIFLNYGEVTVSAGMASFIIGLIPVMTVILSALFLKERQGLPVWAGIGVSFIGLFLISVGEKSHIGMVQGMFMILISAFLGAVYTILSKYYLKRYHPVVVTAWVMWGGTLTLSLFFPALLHEIVFAKAAATLAVIYMGIFPAALAYVAWSYVLNYLSAARASLYLYAMPLVSTVLGFFFLHEIPSMLALVGGIIALSGAVIANMFRQSAPKSEPWPANEQTSAKA